MLCHIYNSPDIEQDVKDWDTESVKGYGEETRFPDGTIAHENYECDDGGRGLVRCKKCGALLLVQYSDYEAMDSDYDGHYADWIPVWSEEEADLLNLYLDPKEFAEFPEKHLRKTNNRYCWIKGEIPAKRDLEQLKAAIREKYSF